MPYKIINWGKYQFHSDRDSNPWVKLHRTILLSADFFAIPKVRRWEWPLLLLLANHATGIIEDNDHDIAFKLRYKDWETVPWDCKPFIGKLLEAVDPSGNHTDTRGCLEERRGENIRGEENRGDVGQEPLSGTRPPSDDEVLRDPKTAKPYEMPLKAKDSFCTIPRIKGQEWHHTFGDSFDVPREIRKCVQYYRDNPAKCKTNQQNAVKSIGNWLRKTQNDGSGQPPLKRAEQKRLKQKMNRAREADEAQAKRVSANIAAKGRGTTPDGPQGLGPVSQQEEE